MFNTIKVNNTDTDYTHSIFDISEYNSGAIYSNLSAALAAVPQEKLKGGMSIKFVTPGTPARYSVVKTENLETEPTGTLLSEAPAIDSGTYDESLLTGVFTTLPSDIGAENALTYYVAVTVDETTTYTSWVVTKVLNSDNNKYVQYRLMSDSFNTTLSNWQGVDDEPTAGSENLVKSEGIIKYVNDLFIDKANSNYSNYWSLIKEIYITNENIDSTCVIKLVNVTRSVSGNWYVQFQVTKNGSTSTYHIYVHSEPSGLQQITNFGYLILDWTNIPNNVQTPLDITLNNKIFDINFSPSIKNALNKDAFAADINAIKVVNDTQCGKIHGHYVYTSNDDGSVPSGFVVGKKITTPIASSFNIISIPVVSGQKFYIPRYTNRNTLNPVLVDDNDIILQVFDITTYTYPDDFVKIDNFYYFEITVEYDGYLLYSDNGNIHGIRSNYPSVKAHNPYPFINTANSQQYLNFVKECYIEDTSGSNRTFFIRNIARNVNGNWYIQFGIEDSEEHFSVSLYSDMEYIVVTGPDVKVHLIVDWNAFPSGQQTNTRIEFNKNAFDFSKTNLIKIYYTKSQINSVIGQEVNQLNTKIESSKSEYKTIAIWSAANLPGYANTSDTDGTPHGTVGQKVTYTAQASGFKHVRVQVNKGEIVYVPYIEGNYTIKNPYLVNKYEVLLQIGDITQIQQSDLVYFEGDSQPHWPFVPESNGYLIMCRNSDFKIYSNISTVRQTKSPEEESETIIPVIGTESLVPFDFEVAKTMNHTMLKSIIESSSNGACTVIYDNNGYPNLMYKIPLTTIGALAPSSIGDLQTPHPAFVVNGVTKRCVYAAVFMNAEYNEVPVSWYGLGSIMRSKSFLQCRTLCAAKGTGWHLETIYERSLISLLSAKYHNNKPRGNNDWGRCRKAGYEYECIQRVDGRVPGDTTYNGVQWYNGTQPDAWSHNNSRWGIFDVVGGYHEWCNLAKVVDGQIYIATDNKYDAEETDWVATGVYIGYVDGKVVYSSQQQAVTELHTALWKNAICLQDYDSISADIRKKLALMLMCPRLSSEDIAPIFDFDGTIWTRRLDEEGYTTYPFLGGATEYSDTGLGFNILSYVGTEAHNNMGSRLFYID